LRAMHLKLFSLFAIFLATARCDLITDLEKATPSTLCDFCTIAVGTIESYSAQKLSVKEIVKDLKDGCKELKDLGKGIEEQCKNFVDVYGTYLVQTVESQSNPATVCETLKFCTATGANADFEILFPVVGEKNITYAITTTTPRTSYKYKFFTGNSTELFGPGEMATLAFALSEYTGDVEMKLSYENLLTETAECKQSEGECIVYMTAHSMSWYYVELVAREPTTVSFNVTERVIKFQFGPTYFYYRRHLSLVSFLLLVSTAAAITCLCLSCCLRLRRGRLNRQRACKKAASVRVEQQEVAIPMEMMMAQAESEYPLIGYYYYPDTGMYTPAYAEPQPPQPYPQAPEFEQ